MKTFLFLLFSVYAVALFGQKETLLHSSVQFEYINGSVIKHKNKIAHLAISRPEGFALNWNQKTGPENKNLSNFNFPDLGYSFIYQDFKNPILGQTFALQLNYSFYFSKRSSKNLVYLKLGQGIAYNTRPFDLESNNKNIAFGSHLLANTTVNINYKRKQILKAFDANIGLMISHYSNGLIKAPNIGLNLLSINTGVSYNFDHATPIDYNATSTQQIDQITDKPVAFNLLFRGGVNSVAPLVGRQFPFYVGTLFADKRLSYKSIVQVGSEIFISNFLKELIKYNAAASPERYGEDSSIDYKRVSLFLGHELDLKNISIITQLGIYIYNPYKYKSAYYERVGLKKYFAKKWFAEATIKAHMFLAESIELGIGFKL